MLADPHGTVLIVDDDEATLMTYAMGLRPEGYVVRTATDAASAWREWDQGPPAAFILDLRLPAAADGMQLLRDLRRRDNGCTPVAVVTGEYALEADVQDELSVLNAQLVFKPIWVEELIALVADMVAREPLPTGPGES